MNVAMVGGTGFVGSYIVESLERNGHHVSLLVRQGSESKIPPGPHFRVTTGSIASDGDLRTVLKGCDAVIYCVGILRAFPGRGITFESTQYDGVVRTVEAALECGVNRMLLMSANGVRIPGTPYQETKRRAEEVVFGSGLDATVFRPSVVFGDPQGRMEIATQLCSDMVLKPFPAASFYTGLDPEKGQILMSPVHVQDVADAFTAALPDSETFGRTFVLGGPEALTWTEMIRRTAAAAGRKKWILPLPVALMKVGAFLFDWLPFFPVTRDQLTMLAEGNTAERRDLETLIGREAKAFGGDNLAYLKH